MRNLVVEFTMCETHATKYVPCKALQANVASMNRLPTCGSNAAKVYAFTIASIDVFEYELLLTFNERLRGIGNGIWDLGTMNPQSHAHTYIINGGAKRHAYSKGNVVRIVSTRIQRK